MAWQKPANLHEWLGLLIRHRKKAFFPAAITAIVVLWLGQALPREYLAEARFRRYTDAGVLQTREGTSTQILASLRRQIIEDIRGRPAIQQLIRDLELTRNLPHYPDGQLTPEGRLAEYEMVRDIQSRLQVSYQTLSDAADLVIVTYRGSDPELASRIVNRSVENYISRTLSQLSETLMKARDYFQSEVVRLTARLEELESQKLRFAIDNPGMMPDDPNSVHLRLAELRAKRDAAEQALQVALQQRKHLEEFIKQQPEFLTVKQRQTNPLVQDLLDKIKALDQEYESHRALGRRDAHPAVQKLLKRKAELQAQIAALAPEVEVNKDMVPNTERLNAMQRLEMLNGEIAARQRELENLTAEVERYELMNRNFFIKRNEYLRIERELAETTNQLRFWEDNLRRVRTALTAEVGQRGVRMSFDQRAPELARPNWPTVWHLFVGAFIAAVAVAVLSIVVAELLDTSFHSIDQAVDSLKLPVLGAVNLIVTPAEAVRQRLARWVLIPAATTLLILLLGVSLWLTWISIEDPIRFQKLTQGPSQWMRTILLRS